METLKTYLERRIKETRILIEKEEILPHRLLNGVRLIKLDEREATYHAILQKVERGFFSGIQ